MFRYPKFDDYNLDMFEYDGNMVVYNPSGEAYVLSPDIYNFALQLDGTTDPLSIAGYSKKERLENIRELKRTKLVRQSRILEKHFGTIYFTLFYKDLNKRFEGIARIWNTLLILSFFPMLLIGILCYINSFPEFEGNIWGGLFFGLLIGIVLHEASHAFASLAFGGKLNEIGLLFSNFLPGAYVHMNIKNIRWRLQRIQVYAAGVEANCFLGGFFLLLASFLPFSAFFFTAGLENIFLGLLNLCFISGLDGSSIIGELLGSESFVSKTRVILFNREIRRKLMRKPSGIAILLAACIFGICQIALPLLLIDNYIAIFEVFQ